MPSVRCNKAGVEWPSKYRTAHPTVRHLSACTQYLMDDMQVGGFRVSGNLGTQCSVTREEVCATRATAGRFSSPAGRIHPKLVG